jgi:hypothetical protein
MNEVQHSATALIIKKFGTFIIILPPSPSAFHCRAQISCAKILQRENALYCPKKEVDVKIFIQM